jgi:hypothetical protein
MNTTRITKLIAAAAIILSSLTGALTTLTPAGAAPSAGGPIARSEILQRAKYWLTNPPSGGYQTRRSASDGDGHFYRQDCSGFVSMSWHLTSAPSTVGLGSDSLSRSIGRDELLPGDIMNVAVGGPGGHVRLFTGWTDSTHTSYNFIDFGGGDRPAVGRAQYPNGWVSSDRGYYVDARNYQPRRFLNVVEDLGGESASGGSNSGQTNLLLNG